MSLKYSHLQNVLKDFRKSGEILKCRADADYDTLESEYFRLMSKRNNLEAKFVDDVPIKVLKFNKDDTAIVCIKNEHRKVHVWWDTITNSAMTLNYEVNVTLKKENALRVSVDSKIAFISDDQGWYNAFPLTLQEGIEESVDWLYPNGDTCYLQIPVSLSVFNKVIKQVDVDLVGQKPDLVSSSELVICRLYHDVEFNITRYYPSIGTFQRLGSRWVLADRTKNVNWLSSIQSERKCLFTRGSRVQLQDDIGKDCKAVYTLEDLYYANSLIMALCRSECKRFKVITPMVELHLVQ